MKIRHSHYWTALGLALALLLVLPMASDAQRQTRDSGWVESVILDEGTLEAHARMLDPDITFDPTRGWIFGVWVGGEKPTIGAGSVPTDAVLSDLSFHRTIETRLYRESGEKRLIQSNPVIADVGNVLQPSISYGNGRLGLLWQRIEQDGSSRIFARVGTPQLDGKKYDVVWLSKPILLSGDSDIAGMHRLDDVWDGNLDIALGQDGTAHAVWSEGEGLLYASSRDGVTWSEAVDVPPSSGENRYPRIAVTADNAVMITSAASDAASDIWMRRSDDGGTTWNTIRNINRTFGFSDSPGSVLMGGELYAVSDDRSRNHVSPDVFLTNGDSRLIVKDGSFPDIATDGERLYVTFVDQDDYDLGYAASRDGGKTWVRDDVPLSSPVAVHTRLPSAINISDPTVAAYHYQGKTRVYVIWIQLERDRSVAKVAWREQP